MKLIKEWFIEAPWGSLALISWGNPKGPGVLAVHGRQDSAATFEPLLELLPAHYHYVGVDMPGNGRSDPFPHGVKLTRFHFVAAVEIAIEHLRWERFVYIGHSMGSEQGLFYNAAYPGRITKMVCLDLGLSLQRLLAHDQVDFYRIFYTNYYQNYSRDNSESKLYTKEKAMEAVMRARGLTKSQAEVILSRNLIHVQDNAYRLSWDNRLKLLAPLNLSVDYFIKLFSKNAPPTLLLAATETKRNCSQEKDKSEEIIDALEENLEFFKVLTVEGSHDVHVTNPERMADDIRNFLDKDFEAMKIESCGNEEFKSYVDDIAKRNESIL